MFTHLGSKFFGLLAISSTKSPSGFVIRRAALTIGLSGAEAPGPEQGGGPWSAVE